MARSKQLTQAVVDAAIERRREYALHDVLVPGLALRVRPSGVKTWVLRRTYEGKGRRLTIGPADRISLAESRRRAGRDGGAVDLSGARGGAGCARKALPSFSKTAAAYLAAREGPTGLGRLKANRCYLRSQLLPAFGELPLDKITPPLVARWFMAYSRKSPGGANTAIALIRTIFNYAREAELAPMSLPDPTAPVPRNRRPSRGRLLSTSQLQRLGRVLADWPDATAADAVRLILLTGCRSGEIIRLRWSEVRMGDGTLSLARTKTGPREVHLPKEATALLRRRRACRMGEAVFPSSKDPNRSTTMIPVIWRDMRAAAGLEADVRLHDLRHSYASHSFMSGEAMQMTGRLLGHAQVSSTDRYAHLDGEFLTAAAERVSATVERMMKTGR